MNYQEDSAPPILVPPQPPTRRRRRPAAALLPIVLLFSIWLAARTLFDLLGTRPAVPPPFPRKGYILINERDELAWYRVAVPENQWTKIADGSFMLDQEYELVRKGKELSLQKTDGANLRTVDVRSGAVNLTSAPRSRQKAPDEWKSGGWKVAFNGDQWWLSGAQGKSVIPNAGKSIGNSTVSQPWSLHDPRHILFVKTTEPTSTSIHFDLLMVDGKTGKSSAVFSVPESNAHFMPDSSHSAIYFLAVDGGLDRWSWVGDGFDKTAHWQLPKTAGNESWRSIFTVLDDWVLYETIVDPSSLLFSSPPRPRYYAFNTKTRASALVLEPPLSKRGMAVAWLDR